jgi:HAD superfamily hydrolase (TIGR01484 family)
MQLIELRPVCVISGGRYEQFEAQVLDHLPASSALENLHLMPTCGTRYLRWHAAGWVQEYSYDLDTDTKLKVVEVLEDEARRLGLWEPEASVFGERIEDRGSQITFSALGQRAPVEAKRKWDPDGSRREALREAVAARLPHLEVRAGGSTSIDITEKGIDKAYGMRRMAEMLGIQPSQILFVGDRLEPGGNDYPVLAAGVRVQAVTDSQETLRYVSDLIDRMMQAEPHDSHAGTITN